MTSREAELSDALRQSEERFQKFMEFSPAAAWIADEEGRFEYVSPAYGECSRSGRPTSRASRPVTCTSALAGLPRLHSDPDDNSRHDELIDVVKTGLGSGGSARHFSRLPFLTALARPTVARGHRCRNHRSRAGPKSHRGGGSAARKRARQHRRRLHRVRFPVALHLLQLRSPKK